MIGSAAVITFAVARCWARGLVASRPLPSWAKARWARCSSPSTNASTDAPRSRCCCPRAPMMRRWCGGSSSRPAPPPAYSHPGIVQVYDCDVHRNGRAYIVMEYLEGETLAKRLERFGVLPWSSACRITRLVAGAISAAHEKKIIHRDLKPGNVFLLSRHGLAPARGGQGAGLRGGQAPGRGRCRRTRHDGGTHPGNARIHVARTLQRRQGVDHRGDVYSLGCMLFEMIVGAPPFTSSQRPRHPGLAQVQEAALAGGADRRGRRPGSTVCVTRMLAKEPDQRPQAMAEVADARHRRASASRKRARRRRAPTRFVQLSRKTPFRP